MKNLLRILASRIVGLLLCLRSSVLRVSDFTSILVVAPHPDDDALGCGGTIALMRHGGTLVHVVYVTDGGSSHRNHPTLGRETLVAIRAREALEALSDLGVNPGDATCLGVADGSLDRLSAEAEAAVVKAMAGIILRVQPDAVLLPSGADGSSEHTATFRLLMAARISCGLYPRVLEFPVWSLWNPRFLVPRLFATRIWRANITNVLRQKRSAVNRHGSQLAPIPPEVNPALPPGFSDMFLGSYEFLIEDLRNH